MNNGNLAAWMLEQEARALLARLARVKPFALHETMVPAAAVSPAAQIGIERFLAAGRRELQGRVEHYLRWLRSREGRKAPAAEGQRRLAFLRLRFNVALSHLDLFSDVLTQRSEHETGVWLSGLDAAAADALRLPAYYEAPPVICYLDRGVGAAIRRARTRLPGGGANPVAIVRVPRERMVGSGVASSLFHETGHQASALLGLVDSLRPVLQERWREAGGSPTGVWRFWERWISEILADFWSVARVGIASTLGLMGVVSLPRAFVFRINLDDPHPFPWIRVKISCAVGGALYPHPQWERLAGLWESFYPRRGLDPERLELLARLESEMDELVSLLVSHRPSALRGNALPEVMELEERQPSRLRSCHRAWTQNPALLYRTRPSVVFAAIGQARADDAITPEDEGEMISRLLIHWALQSTLSASAHLKAVEAPRAVAPAT